MWTITKEFTWEAAHTLEGHPKCGRLHGHSYRAIFELQSEPLLNGMVVDYNELSPIKEFIDTTLDHRFMLSRENRSADHMIWWGMLQRGQVPKEWFAEIDVERSTAESLAYYLFHVFCDDYPQLVAVTVCETAKTSARFQSGRFKVHNTRT